MNNNDLSVKAGNGILNIRVGAIIMQGDKVLMVGNEDSDYFYSVGGRIKFGESAQDAVIREVFEETGVHMQVERLGFVHENFFTGDTASNFGKEIYEISFFFYMKVPENFTPTCNSFTENGIKEHLIWISLDTEKTIYPQFFRNELKNPSNEIKHFVTRDI